MGGSKTLRALSGYNHRRGITLHEALAADDSLSRRGVPVRVIDAYSIKPLEEDTY